MAGIIAVLLAVSLEVLVTLDVIKAVFVIIVHLVSGLRHAVLLHD